MRSGRALNDPDVERLSFRFYTLALVLVSASFAIRTVLLLITRQRDPVNDVMLPLLAVGFGVSAWLSRRRAQVDALAVGAYFGAAVLVLVRLVYLWHFPGSTVAGLSLVESLARFSHWLPGVYVLGFLALDFPGALRFNLLLYACTSGLGLSYAIPSALAGQGLNTLQVVLHQIGADGVLIVVLCALVRINDAYERAHVRVVEIEHAKRLAEQANREKSQFLSRMSHELRTPLNAILGFGQLLEMADLPDKQRQRVRQILSGGQHLLDLINEVLDVSRIETGRLTLASESVRLRELLEENLDLIRPLAARRNVTVQLEGDWDGICVWADRQRLRQVLLNLLSNAVKYNRDRGTVTVSRGGGAEGRVRIAVRDTGIGIAPGHLPRLFGAFERLDAEQHGIEGTGLGLTLAKRLTETMGGTIGVESTVGIGSTFWVDFPLTSGREGPAGRSVVIGDGEAPAPLRESARPTRLVLYIDDNPSNLDLVKRILVGRPELRILPALQGQDGLDMARAHRPHLILLDLHLPDMPGEEVLQRLQADPETRRTPVIIVSADASPGRREQLLAMGASGYLTKPLDVRQFLTVVEREVREHVLARG